MNKHIFDCIDAHTCGNPVRVILDGIPELIGTSMNEKRLHFIKEYDWINPTLKRNQQTSAQRKQVYDNTIGLDFDEADSDGFETFADE